MSFELVLFPDSCGLFGCYEEVEFKDVVFLRMEDEKILEDPEESLDLDFEVRLLEKFSFDGFL